MGKTYPENTSSSKILSLTPEVEMYNILMVVIYYWQHIARFNARILQLIPNSYWSKLDFLGAYMTEQ